MNQSLVFTGNCHVHHSSCSGKLDKPCFPLNDGISKYLLNTYDGLYLSNELLSLSNAGCYCLNIDLYSIMLKGAYSNTDKIHIFRENEGSPGDYLTDYRSLLFC